MPSSTSRSSTRSKSKSPFIPGTPFLTESPAWVQGSQSPVYVDHSGRPYNIAGHPQAPSPRYSDELRSPIPPPPANLYPGSPTAFNVDPGIPFLATAGPTDAGDSDSGRGSVRDEDEELQSGKFVGGFVSGIRKAVRNSLRRSRSAQPDLEPEPELYPPQSLYAQPPQFRDSGYASSIPQAPAVAVPPTGVLSPIADYQEASPTSSRRTRYSARPPSETLVGHQDPRHGFDKDERFTVVQPVPIAEQDQDLPSITPADSILSPISADPEYGSDYAQMNPPTPPPSDTSFNTYLSRVSKIVKDINNLPWIAKERVTKDYYPERSKRRDEPKRHPAIAWRSEAFYQLNYGDAAAAPGSHPELLNSSDASGSATRLITPRPRRRSRVTMDLDAEFDPTPRPTPLPAHPPNMLPPSMPASPLSRLGPPLPVEPPVPSRPPPLSHVPQPSPLTREINPTPNPNPVALPSGSVLFSSQLQPPPPPPPAPDRLPLEDPAGMWQYQNSNPNVNYGAFTTTPRSATSRRSRRSSRSRNQDQNPNPNQYPAQTSTYNPAYTPAHPPQPLNTHPPPPHTTTSTMGNPHPPSPAPNAGRNRAGQDPWQWQPYPQERSGYVPYEFAENYYGAQYGPGVHAARPPVAPPPVSGASSAT